MSGRVIRETSLGAVTVSFENLTTVSLEFGRIHSSAPVVVNRVAYRGSITLGRAQAVEGGWTVTDSQVYRVSNCDSPTKAALKSLEALAIEVVKAWAQSPDFEKARHSYLEEAIGDLEAKKARLLAQALEIDNEVAFLQSHLR